MAKKDKIIIWAIVIIAVSAFVYGFILKPYFDFAKVNVNPEETTLKEARCDISVANPRGIPLVKNGDLVIESIGCVQQYVTNCGRFGIFSDKGTLTLEGSGGIGSSTDVKISEGSSQTYTLVWCGSKLTSSLKAKLYDENGGLLQTKEAVVR